MGKYQIISLNVEKMYQIWDVELPEGVFEEYTNDGSSEVVDQKDLAKHLMEEYLDLNPIFEKIKKMYLVDKVDADEMEFFIKGIGAVAGESVKNKCWMYVDEVKSIEDKQKKLENEAIARVVR